MNPKEHNYSEFGQTHLGAMTLGNGPFGPGTQHAISVSKEAADALTSAGVAIPTTESVMAPDHGIAMAAQAAAGLAAAGVLPPGPLTTAQKNEILHALDGVIKNQGTPEEQLQIGILVNVLIIRRLLDSIGASDRGRRMKIIKASVAAFDEKLRSLVRRD